MFKFHINKLKTNLELIYSITLVITCVYSYLNSPARVCLLVQCNDSVTTVVKAMFPQSLAIACFVSRIVIMYKSVSDFPKYKKKIEEYELYFPTTAFKKKIHLLFTITLVFAYTVIIIPLNIFRVYLIHSYLLDASTSFFYILMYLQNLSICSTEIHFIVRCFGLYQKFQVINENIAVVKSETIITNKYPTVLQNKTRNFFGFSKFNDSDSNENVYPSRIKMNQKANNIELLKMRHQFVKGTVDELNDLYGIQLGMSLIVLFIMALFDIYGEVFTVNKKTRSKILIYGWLIQYSFRFCAIILTTHTTTKQVCTYYLYLCQIIYFEKNKVKECQHTIFVTHILPIQMESRGNDV